MKLARRSTRAAPLSASAASYACSTSRSSAPGARNKAAFLPQELAIAREVPVVLRVGLRDRAVEQSAAPRRRTRDDVEIGRHERHDGDAAQEPREPHRLAVERVGLARAVRSDALDLAPQADLARRDARGAGDAGQAGPLAHDLRFPRRAKRLPGTQERDRLEEIALALRVRTGDDVETALRSKPEELVVAHLAQPQLDEIHAAATTDATASGRKADGLPPASPAA